MPLEFNAVRFKNKNTPLAIKKTSLPVKQDATGKLEVASDRILVKVKAAALNPVDLLLKSAVIPLFSFSEKGFASDYSGDVVAIGASAAAKTSLKVGDKVCGINQVPFGDGTLGEYTLVNPFKKTGASIRRFPEKLTYEQAAAYPLVFGTAESLFDHSKHEKNGKNLNSFNKVLILGAGTSVGRFTVQLAKQVYGSEHIVVTCSGKTEPIARGYGATEVIDYTKHKNILNPVLESVKATGKFDAILDCCGNNDLFPQIGEIIKSRDVGGSYITLVGDAKIDYSKGIFPMLVKNLSAVFRGMKSRWGFLPYYYQLITLDGNDPWPDHVVEYFEKHNIEVTIDSVYDFDHFQQAVDKLESNRAVGKLVITL